MASSSGVIVILHKDGRLAGGQECDAYDPSI